MSYHGYTASQVSGTGTTSVTLSKPSGYWVSGSTLIACVVAYGTTTIPSTPSGWTLVKSVTNGSGGTAVSMAVFSLTLSSAGAASYTFPTTGASEATASVLEYDAWHTSGVDTSVTAASNTGTTSTTLTFTGVTTPVVNEIVVCCAGLGSGSITASGFTSPYGQEWYQLGTSGDASQYVIDAVATTAGATGNITATLSGSAVDWVTVTLALKPPTAAARTPSYCDISIVGTTTDTSCNIFLGAAIPATGNTTLSLEWALESGTIANITNFELHVTDNTDTSGYYSDQTSGALANPTATLSPVSYTPSLYGGTYFINPSVLLNYTSGVAINLTLRLYNFQISSPTNPYGYPNPTFAGGTNGTTTLPAGFFVNGGGGLTIKLVGTGQISSTDTATAAPVIGAVTAAATASATDTATAAPVIGAVTAAATASATNPGTAAPVIGVGTAGPFSTDFSSDFAVSSFTAISAAASSSYTNTATAAPVIGAVTAAATTAITVSASLTGVSSTGSAASVSPDPSPALTGVFSTGAVFGQAGVNGYQNSGLANPIVAGPATLTVAPGATVAVTGITLTDSAQQSASNTALNFSCTSGKLSVTYAGSGMTGNNSAALQITDVISATQAAAATLQYTAPATAGSDSITVQLYDQWGASNQINITVSIAAIASEATQTSIPLTGVSTTGSVGVVTPELSITLTGISSSGTEGTITPELSSTLAGVSSSGAAGAITTQGNIDGSLTGVSSASAVGVVTPELSITLTGVSSTGATATETPELSSTLAGISSSGAAGTLTTQGQTDGSLTGASTTSAAAAVTSDLSIALAGVSSAGAAATETPELSITLAGVASSGTAGAITTQGHIDGSLTGVAATSAAGTGTPELTITLAGVAGSGATGSVNGATGVSGAMTGIATTSAIGAVTPELAILLAGVFSSGTIAVVDGDTGGVLAGVVGSGIAASVNPDTSPAIVGVSSAGAAATETTWLTTALAGVASSGATGTVNSSTGGARSLLGVSSTGITGGVTSETLASITVSATGSVTAISDQADIDVVAVSATGVANPIVTSSAILLGTYATGSAGNVLILVTELPGLLAPVQVLDYPIPWMSDTGNLPTGSFAIPWI